MGQRLDRLREWKSVLKAIVREVEKEYGATKALPISLPLTKSIDAISAEIKCAQAQPDGEL